MSSARIIIIGDEILHGEIEDKNGPWLIKQLNRCNVEVQGLHVIPDDTEIICKYLDNLRAVDYNLVTGGIGPTHDDKTRTAVARAVDKQLVEHKKVLARLEEHYGEKLNEPRRELAMLPEGADSVYLSEMPAIAFVVKNIYVFPGVPDLLQPLFKKWENKFTGDSNYTFSLSVAAFEGDIAEELENLQKKYPDLQFGSYPQGKTITLLVRGSNREKFQQGKEALKKLTVSFKS